MRLIDADALRIVFTEKSSERVCGVELCKAIIFRIDEMPPVDAVPVIRCKDCKWGKETCGNIECWTDMNLPPEYHGYYWYCPNGERKEE